MSRVDIDDLAVEFVTAAGRVRALDGADLHVTAGEAVGVVGESGSGKTTIGLAVGRLLSSSAQRVGGDVRIDGESVFDLGDDAMRRLRKKMAFVFQHPLASLDPTRRIGRQLHDVLGRDRGSSREVVEEQLRRVGLDETDRIIRAYPHMLSGGMAQRVAIAMAFAGRPALVVADEPSASLDAAVREKILDLILDLTESAGASMLLLTHHLPSVARRCTRVAVMYGGRVVEVGAATDILRHPVHPYTQALLRAAIGSEGSGGVAMPIPGLPPVLTSASEGCAFAARCEWSDDGCTHARPHRVAVLGRDVLCVRADEAAAGLAASGTSP